MEKTQSKPSHHKEHTRMVRVAVFCIAAIVIFYLGANFLKGINILGTRKYYYVVLDNISPLEESSSVHLNGYKVGKVTKIGLLSDNPVKICAEILINENVNIPEDSQFEIASKDILGGSVVHIIMGSSREMAKNKDTLTAYVSGAGLDALLAQLSGVVSIVDTIGVGIRDIIYKDGGAVKINNTMTSLESTMKGLDQLIENNHLKVDRLVTDLAQFSAALKEASPQLKHIMSDFENIADSIAKADIAAVIVNANHVITEVNEVVQKINRGDGDIGNLLNNDSLYKNLEASTHHLNLLIKDLKENPGRYVHISLFGGKTKQERMEEKSQRKQQKEAKKNQ